MFGTLKFTLFLVFEKSQQLKTVVGLHLGLNGLNLLLNITTNTAQLNKLLIKYNITRRGIYLRIHCRTYRL